MLNLQLRVLIAEQHTFTARTKEVKVPSCLRKQFLKKAATLWPTKNPELGFTRTASMIASNLSAGCPKKNLEGDRCWTAFEESIVFEESRLVATPNIKITGILITHSLYKSHNKLWVAADYGYMAYWDA